MKRVGIVVLMLVAIVLAGLIYVRPGDGLAFQSPPSPLATPTLDPPWYEDCPGPGPCPEEWPVQPTLTPAPVPTCLPTPTCVAIGPSPTPYATATPWPTQPPLQ